MKKIFIFLLAGISAFTMFGLLGKPVYADEAASTNEATDYDTTLDEMIAVKFDSAFGLESSGKLYSATSVDATADGGYLVGGSMYTAGWAQAKAQLIKYTSDYEVDWTFSFEDNPQNLITAVLEDSNGNLMVFGTELVVNDNGTPEDSSDDVSTLTRVLRKLDATDRSVLGTFTSSANEATTSGSGTIVESNSVIELSDGNILVSSIKDDNLLYEIVDPSDMTLVTSGLYGSTADDKIENVKVAADPNGGFYVTGGFAAMDGNLAALGLTLKGNMDILVSKFDNSGAVQWTQQLGSTGGWNAGFALAYYDGFVYLAGEQFGTADQDFATLTNQGNTDALIVKLAAADGAVQWMKSFGGSEQDSFQDVKVTADGVFLGGLSRKADGVTDGDLSFHAGTKSGNFVVKVDHDGNKKAAALHHARFSDVPNTTGITSLDVLASGEMVYAARMGYWVNLYNNVNATNATHGFTINSYNFDNPLKVGGSWPSFQAGTAVVNIGVDTANPVVEGTAYLAVPVGYTGPLFDGITDDFAHENRMEPGVVGAVDFNNAGTYTVTITAEDYAGNVGTLDRTIVVYDTLDQLSVNSETVSTTLPTVVLMQNDDYACEMNGVSVTLTNNTLTASCETPDTSLIGEQEVVYTYSNDDYLIQTSRTLEVILNIIGVNEGDQVYTEQEVRVPFGYTVTVDGVAVNDKDVISAVGAHTVVYNDGEADTTVNFEILEIVQGVEDGGFYADETTITFDEGLYSAKLDDVAFASGTTINTWGHYKIEFTELADVTNVITMNFLVGDENYRDLFEHGVLDGIDYITDGNLTRINGSASTADGGSIVVGESDGAMLVVKYDASGNVEFRETFDSSGADMLNDVVEISAGRYAAIGFIAALDQDFAGKSLNNYPNGEENWYNYRVILDIHYDGTNVTFDAFNGESVEEGLVNGSPAQMGQAQIEYDNVDNVLYISQALAQWSFQAAGGQGSHDVYVAQYSVDADSFDYAWHRTYGSDGWDRIGRMSGYGSPLAVVPGQGIVTGYSSKFNTGTIEDESDKILGSSTDWYPDEVVESAIIIRVDNTGTTSWIKTMAGNNYVFFIDVEVDADGNIFVAGSHDTNAAPDTVAPYGDFDSSVDNASTEIGNRDLYVAKLDSSGETVWLEVLGTLGADEMKDIEIDSQGNVYIVGYTDGSKEVGGDLYVEPRLNNTRTLVGKMTADGTLIALENYNSEEFSIFNSVVVNDVNEIIAFGYLNTDETFMQSQTDFLITDEIANVSKYVGMAAEINFEIDTTDPTVTSVPEIVIEEGLGSLEMLNDITDSIFENIIFDFSDTTDAAHLTSYEVTGTVDFDAIGDYTLSFVAYDMRQNASVVTDLVVHVIAETSNEDGTVSINGVDYVVADMGDASLDLDNDNSAFVYDAGTVTVVGETLVKEVFDLNVNQFDITIPGVYSIVEVFGNENYFVVLDKEIKLLGGIIGAEEGVTYDDDVVINFAGTAKLNDYPYISGTKITEAGNHVIELIEFEGATPIIVHFTISSGANIEDEMTYSKTTTPVFRGTATLNGEAFVSGTDISNPGVYTLVISGAGEYQETYTFTITSGVNATEGTSFDDAFILTFRGTATLNGEAVTSGTELTLPGAYALVITGNDGYQETVNFTISSGLSGVTDGANVGSGTKVTIRYNTGTATLSVDGGEATALSSGTRLSEDGLYVVTIQGEGSYTEVITFRIGEEPVTTCPVGEELVDGSCQAITCGDGEVLDGNNCVPQPAEPEEELSPVVITAIIAAVVTLGAGAFVFIRKR